MIFRWLKNRHRREVAAPPLPEAWAGYLEKHFEHWSFLGPEERLKLEDITQVLVEEKHWEGCGGLELTDEIRVTIAAQAGLLLLGIDHDYYENVESILVYPSSYKLPRAQRGAGGVVTEEEVPVLGSAHQDGPVVVAWDSAERGGRDGEDGRNVVYHEFAHKLDMLDGVVDGTPELDSSEELRAWVAVMTEEFERLRALGKRKKKGLIDAYGATSPGEFFAVATEVFFEKPVRMKREQAKLYAVLAEFYGQDPAARMQ